MGSRSRKRRRSGADGPARPKAQPAAAADADAAAPSQRRTNVGSTATPVGRPPAPIGARKATAPGAKANGAPGPIRAGYARGRERDESIRASLEPLQPGERPQILTLAAIVAFAFAIANAAAALSGNDIASPSGDPTVLSIVTTALLFVAGAGMLARQYWAVLGFQTILGIQIVFFSLYLLGVQRLWQAIIPLVAIGLLGWLFWKLVRAMARLQMPERPPG